MRFDVSALVFVVASMAVGCHGGPYPGLRSDEPLGDATVDDTGVAIDTSVTSSPEAMPLDVAAADGRLDADVDGGFVRDGHYPKARSFKALFPNGGTIDEIVANGAGRVYFEAQWQLAEPRMKPPPCALTETEFERHCFVIDPTLDSSIKAYTDAGVIVGVVLDASPYWSRTARSLQCNTKSPSSCAPDDPADFARYAGMLAQRYGDLRTPAEDHGRISDFIVWPFDDQAGFDVGTPPAGTSVRDYWLDTYVTLFTDTYDEIVANTGEVMVLAKVPRSFADDDFAAFPGRLSPRSLIGALTAKGGSRSWQLALEPRAVDPNFRPDDALPTVTFGNLGQATGLLRAQLSAVSSAHKRVVLVDGAFDSAASRTDSISGATGQAAQAEAMCRAYRQALATPGIDAWSYAPFLDSEPQASAGVFLGLQTGGGGPKASWIRWAQMDVAGKLDCGFGSAGYLTLWRRWNGVVRWVTTRMALPGFGAEAPPAPEGWRLSHDLLADTRELFECSDPAKGKHFVSFDVLCEGQTPMGSLGFAWTTTAAGRVEIFRCDKADGTDSLVSGDATCEGYSLVTSLGWVLPK